MSKTFKLLEVPVAFKNFSGLEGEYNRAGDRNFTIAIHEPSLAGELTAAGYNLRPFEDEDGNIEGYYLGIRVNYKSPWPPRIYTVSPSTGKRVLLSAETVECLDSLTIQYVDVEFNPHEWTVGGNSGWKPYCRVLFALIEEHPFDLKWEEYEQDRQDGVPLGE